MKSTPLPIVLQASAAAASFFHWGHHDEGIVKHYKAHGPFDNGLEAPIGWESACEAHGTFKARQYDLAVEGDRTRPLPFGLGPWEGAIKNFLHGRAYPGHFRGDKGEEDGSAHGSRKVFLTMEWTEVPRAVRRWVEDHQRKEWVDQHEHWMFAVLEHPQGDETIPSTLPPPPASTAVGEDGAAAAPSGRVVEDKDKVLFFAAGAIYELLPLWVAEGSQCESKSRAACRERERRFKTPMLTCRVRTLRRPFGSQPVPPVADRPGRAGLGDGPLDARVQGRAKEHRVHRQGHDSGAARRGAQAPGAVRQDAAAGEAVAAAQR